MLNEITATYDGKNFVPDEVLDLPPGKKVTVIISDYGEPKRPKRTPEEAEKFLRKFSGSGGKMFGSVEKADAYVRELRADERF